MERIEKKLKLSDEKFKRRVGTTKQVFQTMLDVLQIAYDKLHEAGGKPPDLTIGDKLLITLKYYREYTTMESIADDYNCSKSSVYRSIRWVETTLAADGRFQLPGKDALKKKLEDDSQDDDIIDTAVDVTEHPINRPKDSKEQKEYFSGKKKGHRIKSQIIADRGKIYDVDEAPGSVHDFELCKSSLLTVLILAVIILADSGYQGIQNYHEFSLIPIKKPKGKELSESAKAYNTGLSRQRIFIENINAKIKVFKIMSYSYRNRRASHLLRTKLVCAILNAEKACKQASEKA
jgi:predicted DNA-binding protein YlxM (UPF0122 family)